MFTQQSPEIIKSNMAVLTRHAEEVMTKGGKIIIYCFHWPDLANWPNVSNVILDRSVQAYIGQIWPLINGTICPHIEKI